MGTYLTERTAIDAVDFLITLWRERMVELIDQIDAPSVTEPKAKAAFWLGLGLNAANHIFPEHTPQRVVDSRAGQLATAGLKRVALPVWVMSQVQSFFVDRYGARLARTNDSLFASHVQFRDQLVDQVTAIASGFIATDYGRLITRALMQHFQGHKFDRPEDAITRTRNIIRDAGLITTERNLLRQQIAPGLESMTDKVALIASACPSSPARRQVFSPHRQRLFYSPSGDMEWVRWMNGPARTRYSDKIEITDPAQALQLMSQAYRMDVLTGSRVFPNTSPYSVYTTTVVQKYPNRAMSDLIPSFAQAEAEVMQALRTASGNSRAA